MNGLLLKDMYNLRQQSKIYIILLVFWLVISVINKDGAFFGGVIMIFSTLIPLSSIAYDEKSKWERFALTMPISKSNIVGSKYLLALVCSGGSTIISLIVNYSISKDLVSSIEETVLFFSIGLIFVSVILPIIFKFGVEKGRVIMILVFLIPTVLTIPLSNLDITAPSEDFVNKLILTSPILAFIVLLISLVISKMIYEKKEF